MEAAHQSLRIYTALRTSLTGKSNGVLPWVTKIKSLLMFVIAVSVTPLYGQLDIGSDVVSRYIWRGTDYGNSASIQPYISYTIGGFEAGAWSSWAITSPGPNENDLYLSWSGDLVGVTLTDYYFPVAAGAPGSDFFDYDAENGSHTLEVTGSLGTGPFTAMAAVNFLGDPDNSVYLEGSYQVLSEENLSADVTVGAGNAVYVSSPEKGLNVVNMALNVVKGSYLASYVLNPEARISWLVFGIRF